MGAQSASRAGDGSWLDTDVGCHPKNVFEALRALDTVTERLCRDGDPRAAFPDIYAIITRRVSERVALGRGAFFLEPEWIARLAGRFCERYLETLRFSLEGAPQDAGAWSVAYACCDVDDMLPVNHVMLGLSAHINYDLALGIAANIAELGGRHDPSRLARYKHDHDAVNQILREAIPEAFEHLIQRHHCPCSRLVHRSFYSSAEWLVTQLLTAWRERVWGDALDLLNAQDDEARDAVRHRVEVRSRNYARLLAAPGVVPLPTNEPPRRHKPTRSSRAAQLFHALS